MATFNNKVNYVIQTFCDTLGIKGEVYDLPIQKLKSNIEYFNKFSPYDVNNIRYFIWKGKKVPYPVLYSI